MRREGRKCKSRVRVKDKGLEKIKKYQFLRKEIGKLWKLKKVTIVWWGHWELYPICLRNTRESLTLPSGLKWSRTRLCGNSWTITNGKFWLFKTNLSYEPVKNLRYNMHCFDVMLIFPKKKKLRTIHTSMTSTFFFFNLSHLLKVKHWQYSHWNVLVMDTCIVRINLEKLV